MLFFANHPKYQPQPIDINKNLPYAYQHLAGMKKARARRACLWLTAVAS
jgi:hypothetical protein